MEYGINLLLWTSHVTGQHDGVLEMLAAAGYDRVEIPIFELDVEPTFAEAHYNLATIFDRSGEAQAAIRHINEYRKLTR